MVHATAEAVCGIATRAAVATPTPTAAIPKIRSSLMRASPKRFYQLIKKKQKQCQKVELEKIVVTQSHTSGKIRTFVERVKSGDSKYIDFSLAPPRRRFCGRPF